MRRFDFSTMTVGGIGSGAACLLSREQRTTRKGDPYLILELGNRTGRATTKIWSESVEDWAGQEVGAPVRIEAKVVEGWNGRPPELEIQTFSPLEANHPVVLELNPLSPVPRKELEQEFDELVASITRTDASVLLDVVMRYEIDGVPVRERYFAAPAAMKVHHASIHGLAEHSIEVTRMALQLAAVEPYAQQIDQDLLIVGGLLHDLGKIDEYAWEGVPIGIAPFGRLRSHLSRGAEIVGLAIADSYALQAGVTSREDLMAVQHVIESHHGEYGSVVSPRCMEAMLIHVADLCSARLRVMLDAIETVPMDEDSWVQPPGWKKEPVWHLVSALDRSEPEEEDVVPIDGRRTAAEDVQAETAVYIPVGTGGTHG